MSEFHDVTVLVRADRIVESNGLRPPSLRLVPVEVPAFRAFRKFGSISRAVYYQLWQRAAYRVGRELLARERFDVVHQVTFHTFRVPGLLARPELPPFVWGPIAGLESIPLPMFSRFGRATGTELIRAMSNSIMPRSPSIVRTLRQAAAVVVSNHQTMRRLDRVCDRHYDWLPANALDPAMISDLGLFPYSAPVPGGEIRLLAVGTFVRMRAFDLVLQAVDVLPREMYQRLSITFVGGGPDAARLRELAKRSLIRERILFTGPLPRAEVFEAMRRSHLLLFPSLRDSGGSAIPEAMALGLPVLAFDCAPPADMLSGGGGLLATVTTPSRTRQSIAEAVASIVEDPQRLHEASNRARASAQAFRWDRRIEEMNAIYERVLRDRGTSRSSGAVPVF